MSTKDKKVSEFLDTTVSLYGFSPLSDLKKRELKFKLGLADIKDVVKSEDLSLALDIVLAELQPTTAGAVKTASAAGRQSCPRCGFSMCGVKINASTDALYCSSCHVTVPVR